jgi:MoxR-like ATPase
MFVMNEENESPMMVGAEGAAVNPMSNPAVDPYESVVPESVNPVVALLEAIRGQLGSVFLGQDEVIRQVMAALLAGGHVLLEGKPGLGKTHLVLALARCFGGHFRRIQFTPDLMPSDVTGHTIYEMASGQFRLRQGPIFTQLLLADEINRAPAKTQSALLEVMAEGQVTIDGESYRLTPPFMTVATQNPIEQEGTYPLPEAQLDRFLLKVIIDYPAADLEAAVVRGVCAAAGGRGLSAEGVATVTSPESVLELQRLCAAVEAVESVVEYAVALVRATRSHGAISLGAGTRGAISLVRVAKAYALMDGRDYITPGDVKSAVLPVLRHRVTLAPEVAIRGEDVDEVLELVVKGVEAPRV